MPLVVVSGTPFRRSKTKAVPPRTLRTSSDERSANESRLRDQKYTLFRERDRFRGKRLSRPSAADATADETKIRFRFRREMDRIGAFLSFFNFACRSSGNQQMESFHSEFRSCRSSRRNGNRGGRRRESNERKSILLRG